MTLPLAALLVAGGMVAGVVLGGIGFAASSHSSRVPGAGPVGAVSLFGALSAADPVAGGVDPGGWVAFAAVGLAPHSTVSIPGPEHVSSYNCSNGTPTPVVTGETSTPPCIVNSTGVFSPVPCPWTALGGHNLTSNESIVVPGMGGSVGTGLAVFWGIAYAGPVNRTLFVIVLGGVATPYATEGGPGCGPFLAHYKSLEGSVIDSVATAAIVNAWGGAAFLANTTNASAVYGVVAPATYDGVTYLCGNTTGGPAPRPTNGSCQNSTTVYSEPARWTVAYSACWLPFLPLDAICRTPGVLLAELNGSTGVPIFVTISMEWWCGWFPVCFYPPLASPGFSPAAARPLLARSV